ncbi:MAG: hypothetical protein ABEI13_01265, partial [Candidatus Paceibacteria bacterium]
EEFWEHAELERNHFFDPREYYGIGHGHTLFQEIINIPIIVWGVEEENTRTHRVSTADIAPTILDQLGDNTSQSNSNLPMRFDGISLEKEKKHDVVLSEETAYGYEKKAIMKEEYKLIVSEGDDVRFLFNLSEDPGEKQPLDNDDIKNRLFDLIPEQKQTGEAIDLDKDVNKRLKDLGYI